MIYSLKIENFKNIESFEGDIMGKNVYLIGGNNKGKTSFIQAVFCGLTGKDVPPDAVMKGKREGQVTIDLGEIIATTTFKKAKPIQLELKHKETGEKIASPRTYLNSLVGIIDFDVNEFFAKSAAEQVKYFAKICPDMDTSEVDGQIEEVMESRKFDKKKLLEAESHVVFWKKDDAEKEPIDLAAAYARIAQEEEKGRVYVEGQRALNEIELSISTGHDTIMSVVFDLHGWIEEEINVQGPNRLGGLFLKAENIRSWLHDPANVPLTPEQMEVLRKEIADADIINAAVTAARTGKAADEAVKVLKEAVKVADKELDDLRLQKAKIISDNINIDGLTYDVEQESFLWDGFPFDSTQINTASQLIAGLKIASMMLKEVRILRLDASLVDNAELKKVKEWADLYNIALFIERVDMAGGDLQIVIDEN